jgi:hypothetical protein
VKIAEYTKAHNIIKEFYQWWQSSEYSNITDKTEIVNSIKIIHGNSGILRADKSIANLMSTCFMFGLFVANYEDKPSPITMDEQEQALRCLECGKLDNKMKCTLEKCKYER